MDNELEQLKRIYKAGTSLSAGEKLEMKNKLEVFMRANPISKIAPVRPSKNIISPHSMNFFVRFAALGFTALVISFGVSSYAEKAIPGDLLYTIKTSVNEPLRSLFVQNDKDAGLLGVQITERRLEEAEQLAADGRLTDEAKTTLQTQILSNINKVHATIQKLQEQDDSSDAVMLSTELESSLRAHEQILSGVAGDSGNAVDLANTIGAESVTAGVVRSTAEASALSTSDSQSLIKAKKELADAKVLLRETQALIPSIASASGVTEQYLNQKISDATKLIGDSSVAISNSDALVASSKANEARSILKEVSVLAEAKVSIPDSAIMGTGVVNNTTATTSATLMAPAASQTINKAVSTTTNQ